MPATIRRRRPKGSGSVYFRRADQRWVGDITVGGQRHALYGESAAEVEQRLADLRLRIMPRANRADRMEDYLRSWLRGLAANREVRERTQLGYETIVKRHLVPALGPVRLGDLNHRHVNDLLDGMARAGLSPGTRHNVRACLSKALRDAVQDELITENPVRRARSIKGRQMRPMIRMDDLIAQAILAACEQDPLYDLVALALYTGMRQGELLALDWSDFRMKPPTLAVMRSLVRTRAGYVVGEPKTTNAKRTVPLPREAFRTLVRRYSASRRPKGGPIFPAVRDPSRPLSPSEVSHRFRALMDAAGRPGFRFHDLRHATATLLISRGVELPTVSRMLGHSRPSITLDIYAGVATDAETRAAAKLTFWGEDRSWPKNKPPPPLLRTRKRREVAVAAT